MSQIIFIFAFRKAIPTIWYFQKGPKPVPLLSKTPMRKLASLFLLVFLALPALAAPVRFTGKVVEAGSKDPVIGAVVRLDEDYLCSSLSVNVLPIRLVCDCV